MGMGPVYYNGNTGGRNVSTITGDVSTTTPTVNRGVDFSVAKTGTGDVTITLTQAMSGGIDHISITPIAAAGGGGGTGVIYKLITASVTGAGFRVQFQTDAGTAVETQFLFEIRGSYDAY